MLQNNELLKCRICGGESKLMSNNLKFYNADAGTIFLTTVEIVFQDENYRGVFTHTQKIRGVIPIPGAMSIVEDIVYRNMETAELISVNGAKINYDKVTEEFYLELIGDKKDMRKYDELYIDDIADMIVSIRIIKQEEVQHGNFKRN